MHKYKSSLKMHKCKSSLSQEKCTSTRAHSNAQVQELTQSGEMHKYKSTLAGCTENAQVQEHTGRQHRKHTSTRAHRQAAQKMHKYKSTQAAQKTHKYVQGLYLVVFPTSWFVPKRFPPRGFLEWRRFGFWREVLRGGLEGGNVLDRTNRLNKGLISVDRNKRMLLYYLQYPVPTFKSSAKDLSHPIFGIVFQRTTHTACFAAQACLKFMALELHRQLYLCACNKG